MPEARPLKKPVDWDELYPGRFLKAGQIGEGKRVTVTIREVNVERLQGDDGQERVRGVIRFAEMAYELALNKTNGLLLREMFGRLLEKWPGRKVTLYRGTVESGSQKGQPAVRIWGSPELAQDREVEIKLPRKRPMRITLHHVDAAAAQRKPDVDKHPTEGQGQDQGGEPAPF